MSEVKPLNYLFAMNGLFGNCFISAKMLQGKNQCHQTPVTYMLVSRKKWVSREIDKRGLCLPLYCNRLLFQETGQEHGAHSTLQGHLEFCQQQLLLSPLSEDLCTRLTGDVLLGFQGLFFQREVVNGAGKTTSDLIQQISRKKCFEREFILPWDII